MDSFVAFAWSDQDPSAVRRAEQIQQPIDTVRRHATLKAGHYNLTIYNLGTSYSAGGWLQRELANEPGAACVVGRVFRRKEAEEHANLVVRLTEQEVRTLVSNAGLPLVRDYWGRYVGFVLSTEGVVIIEDPTAGIPCYYSVQDGVAAVFTHLELCPFLDYSRFTIDDDYISTLLAYDKFQSGRTGLREVSELLGGQRLRVTDAGVKIDAIWAPTPFGVDPLNISDGEAMERLRSVTQLVVKSWANSYRKAFLSISGGLDSAIVTGCLSANKCNAELSAVHFVMESEDASERQYAKAVAGYAGLSLEEIKVAPDIGFPEDTRHPPTARPLRQFLAPDLTDILASRHSLPGGVRLTGQGGDHLFRSARNALGFADFLLANGLGRETTTQLLSAARLSGKSVWQVLSECLPVTAGLSRGYREDAYYSHRRAALNEAAYKRLSPENSMPRWAATNPGMPPGKFEQIRSLVHLFQIRNYFSPKGTLDTAHPLISQPLIELCARLPTYTLSCDGKNRGLARKAFRGVIPREIEKRTTKGAANRFYVERLESRRELITQTLMTGELVKRELLSADQIETFMGTDSHKSASSGSMLSAYFCIESWLRTWEALSGREHATTALQR